MADAPPVTTSTLSSRFDGMMFMSTTSAWLDVETERRPSIKRQRARAEDAVHAAQVGDGLADEEGAAFQALHAGAAAARLVVAGHVGLVGGNVLRHQLGEAHRRR